MLKPGAYIIKLLELVGPDRTSVNRFSVNQKNAPSVAGKGLINVLSTYYSLAVIILSISTSTFISKT